MKTKTMKCLCFGFALLVAAFLSVAPAHAKTDFGVRAGSYTDSENPFLGAEALFHVGDSKQWFGNPNLEHAFADGDHSDLTAVSFDFHYDFPTGRPFTMWAGAGPTMILRDRDSGLGRTDGGVNVLFGIGAKQGDVRPYGQMKVVMADDSEAVLGVGVRF